MCRQRAGEIGDLVGECICEYMAAQTIRICYLDKHGLPKVVEIDESLFLKEILPGKN